MILILIIMQQSIGIGKGVGGRRSEVSKVSEIRKISGISEIFGANGGRRGFLVDERNRTSLLSRVRVHGHLLHCITTPVQWLVKM